MANLPADLFPHAQVAPAGVLFSAGAREQVHSPARRWSGRTILVSRDIVAEFLAWDYSQCRSKRHLLHEQRAPVVMFSVSDFSHVQCIAGF